MATLQNSGTRIPIFVGNTAEGGFFSPVENAYWRGFSRVCVDYNTAIGGKKRVVFSKETIEVPGNFATFENLLWRFSDDC